MSMKRCFGVVVFLGFFLLCADQAHAQKFKITAGNVSQVLFLGGPLKLACFEDLIGVVDKRRLKPGAKFKTINVSRKTKSAAKQIKRLQRQLKKSSLGKQHKKKLKSTLKRQRAIASSLEAAVQACRDFGGGSSSSSSASSVEPCRNGVLDPGEKEIDCEGVCPYMCNPFVEHFDNTARIAVLNNAELDGQGQVRPTHQIYGQEVIADENTKLLFHFNRDVAAGENDMFVHDWSGNNNTGRNEGAVYRSEGGLANHSLYMHFDQPNQKISVPDLQDSIDREKGLTIALWVRNNDFAANQNSYIWQFSGTKHIRFLNGGGTLRVCHTSAYCRNYTDIIADNDWHHLALSIAGSEWSLYLDGEFRGSTDGGVGLAEFPDLFSLYFGGTAQYGQINLSLDEAAVWNMALNAEQISGLYRGKRACGNLQSKAVETSQPAYFVTASWNQDGFPVRVQVSGGGAEWCDVSNGGTVDYFNCGLPSRRLFYRIEFAGDASVDDITLFWRTIPAACDDLDGDGFDNWNGHYQHCSDDGRPRDCDDNNARVFPGNSNKFCNCSDQDGYPRQAYESYHAGHCRDGIDNDCDGLVDYEDPDCAEDPESWENLHLKFSGIDLSVKGSKFHDYMYERLWFDQKSDDDAVLYLKSARTQLKLSNNAANLKGGGLPAHSASLIDRDLSTGLQARETIRVRLKDAVRQAKAYDLNFKISAVEHPGSFDLLIDDLDTPGIEERFNGLTLHSVENAASNIVDLTYTGSPLKREIDLPRSQEQRIHSGYIIYRIDGDEFSNSLRYDYSTSGSESCLENPTTPRFEAMLADPELAFFRYNGPFSLAAFKGRVGNNGKQLYDPDRVSFGLTDAYSDEWHTLTFWHDDPHTNCYWDRRDDGSSDAKIVQVVLDPQTPVISFDAPAGEQFYTTPAKTYYTPHIFEQTTYLTPGVEISLHNITDASQVFYRVGSAAWQRYSGKIKASDIFASADSSYQLQFKIGSSGTVRTRRIHYQPAQPAQNEQHPRLRFSNMAGLLAERQLVHGGDYDRTRQYEHYLNNYILPSRYDFRQGTRSLGYSGATGYFYLPKTLGGVAADFAYYGTMENSDVFLKKAKDALLFFYTVDPVACESGKGRSGGPSQERCMYSDGRVILGTALAYDLLFHYTRENGYAHGMTPIEHLKIRDNLAGEASLIMRYPQTWPDKFWLTQRYGDNGTRNLQLEATFTLLAMAMPSYDSAYYGTSGADGLTQAAHLHAPFPDARVAWSDVHFKGFVQHPSQPNWTRDSIFRALYEPDGAYVGTTRCCYDHMMYQDILPFMVYRRNFDGHHYQRLENNLRLEIMGRYPHNGERLPDAIPEGSAGRAIMPYQLPYLINSNFPEAGLYLWTKTDPTPITSSLDYLMDKSIVSQPPPVSSLVADNYAIFARDLSNSQTVFLRSRVLSSLVPHSSGSALKYAAGDFDMVAYGERLAIDLGGYGSGDWNKLRSQNVVMLDGQNDGNYNQVRGTFEGAYYSPYLDYARMKTNLEITAAQSSFKQRSINQTRHIFFADKKFFVMLDQMRSQSGVHDYDFILHGSTAGSSAPDAFNKDLHGDKAVWKKPSGVRLLVQFGSDVSLNSGDLIAHDYIDGHDEPYIMARLSGSDVDFLTLLYPLDAGAAGPQVTRINGSGYDAMEIIGPDGHFIAMANRSGQLVGYAGLETDAEVALAKTDAAGQVVWFAMINGKDLRYLGEAVFTAPLSGDYFGP